MLCFNKWLFHSWSSNGRATKIFTHEKPCTNKNLLLSFFLKYKYLFRGNLQHVLNLPSISLSHPHFFSSFPLRDNLEDVIGEENLEDVIGEGNRRTCTWIHLPPSNSMAAARCGSSVAFRGGASEGSSQFIPGPRRSGAAST
jgi:hypothetical protein